jgi:excisionase family DNA binding protein
MTLPSDSPLPAEPSLRAYPPSSNAALLRPAEAAALLAVSIKTIRRLARAGQLPSVAIGTCLRFRLEDVQRFIEANRRETPAQVAPLRGGGQRLQVSELPRHRNTSTETR